MDYIAVHWIFIINHDAQWFDFLDLQPEGSGSVISGTQRKRDEEMLLGSSSSGWSSMHLLWQNGDVPYMMCRISVVWEKSAETSLYFHRR